MLVNTEMVGGIYTGNFQCKAQRTHMPTLASGRHVGTEWKYFSQKYFILIKIQIQIFWRDTGCHLLMNGQNAESADRYGYHVELK